VNKFKVRVYQATNWSLLTQADHFEDFIFETNESLEKFSQELARTGFSIKNGKKWIMPGAIVSVDVV
jgi:hypothetical protein